MDNLFYASPCGTQNFYKYDRAKKKLSTKRSVLTVFASLIIGAINGLFGAGGGMLTVPLLNFVVGLDEKHSHATAIAVILPLCLVSSIVYMIEGSFENGVILPTVIGVAIGGIVGALLLKKMSNETITLLFYGIMLFAGLKMLF